MSTRKSQSTNRDLLSMDETTVSETQTGPQTGGSSRAASSGPTSSATSSATSGGASSPGQVADQVKQSASQMTEQARQAASSQLASRKDQAAQGLGAVSSAVRQMGDNLSQNERTSPYAQYAHQAADQVERFSGYLQQRDVRGLVWDAENWARHNPAIFLGGAFAIGLFAARFLKSSGGSQMSPSARLSQYSGQQYWNDRYR